MSQSRTKLMHVARIERQEDRILLYASPAEFTNQYYVIASLTTDVHIHDLITYEPYGVNFGWYIATVQEES